MGNARQSYEGPQVPEGIRNYGKIKVGVTTLDDAVLELGYFNKKRYPHFDKHFILKALHDADLPKLQMISEEFYRMNGIYARVCNSIATLYRFDWFVAPEVYDEKVKEDKIIDELLKVLYFLDDSHVAATCENIAREVIVKGAYYGYIIDTKDCCVLQQLPLRYCRSRFSINGRPVVEFNMQFFDDMWNNTETRMKILNMFPAEFKKGYMLFKQHKLPPDDLMSPWGSWYVLEPGRAWKFSMLNGDIPFFINAIPSIIDLDEAQDLDRRKQMQQLLKILIQKLPLDKNGDLIFDLDEAQDIHENAVDMLKRAIGVDVLTTFADVTVEDMADKNTTTTRDDLEKMERTVYNSLGLSRNLFNTDSNLALEKSILNDEGVIRPLLLQFKVFYDIITRALSSGKKAKYTFRFYMLETTQYNYKEMAKMYKEQVQVGYSKLLPQIALGHSQSSILNGVHFENEVLHLSELMLPPLQSSTLNAEGLAQLGGSNSGNGKTGRPKKEDSEKAPKTIANEEAK